MPQQGPEFAQKRRQAVAWGRACLLLSTPVAVGLCLLLGWGGMISLEMQRYTREMFAAGAVIFVAGIAATLPMIVLLNKGAVAMARGALSAHAIRLLAALLGALVLMAPHWHLQKSAAIEWVLGFYFVLLIIETAASTWVMRNPQL